MWTPTTRRQHSRAGLRYGSDLTDAEWAILEPLPRQSHDARRTAAGYMVCNVPPPPPPHPARQGRLGQLRPPLPRPRRPRPSSPARPTCPTPARVLTHPAVSTAQAPLRLSAPTIPGYRPATRCQRRRQLDARALGRCGRSSTRCSISCVAASRGGRYPATFRPGARCIAGLRACAMTGHGNVNHVLVMQDRARAGREASPTAAVIDSQSVKTVIRHGKRPPVEG